MKLWEQPAPCLSLRRYVADCHFAAHGPLLTSISPWMIGERSRWSSNSEQPWTLKPSCSVTKWTLRKQPNLQMRDFIPSYWKWQITWQGIPWSYLQYWAFLRLTSSNNKIHNFKPHDGHYHAQAVNSSRMYKKLWGFIWRKRSDSAFFKKKLEEDSQGLSLCCLGNRMAIKSWMLAERRTLSRAHLCVFARELCC